MIYRNNLPTEINNKLGNQCIRSQPAARQRGSPIIGNQENNKIGLPYFFSRLTAFICDALDSPSTEYRIEMSRPIPHEVIAPMTLPNVAIIINKKIGCSVSEARFSKTASEPPGKSVEEIKALKNKIHRDINYSKLSVFIYFASMCNFNNHNNQF